MASNNDGKKYKQPSLFSFGVKPLRHGGSEVPLPKPEPLKKAEQPPKRRPGRPRKAPEQQTETIEEVQEIAAEEATVSVDPVWQVRIRLQTVRETSDNAPWEEPQADRERVKLQLVLVDARQKRKRTLYSAEQKALALRVLEKAGNSPSLAARRLLLSYGELFPDMNEITGEKNLRSWFKEAEKKTYAIEQDDAQQNTLQAGRKPIFSETCLQVIYRVINDQVRYIAAPYIVQPVSSATPTTIELNVHDVHVKGFNTQIDHWYHR